MEKDTVTISLDLYNQLRDFKERIEQGYTCKIYDSRYGYRTFFISTEDAVKQISDELKKEKEENYQLINSKAIGEYSTLDFIKYKLNTYTYRSILKKILLGFLGAVFGFCIYYTLKYFNLLP